jgi:hypothetical protein
VRIRVSSDGKIEPEAAARFFRSIGEINVYSCAECRELIVVPPRQDVQHLCARPKGRDGC